MVWILLNVVYGQNLLSCAVVLTACTCTSVGIRQLFSSYAAATEMNKQYRVILLWGETHRLLCRPNVLCTRPSCPTQPKPSCYQHGSIITKLTNTVNECNLLIFAWQKQQEQNDTVSNWSTVYNKTLYTGVARGTLGVRAPHRAEKKF